MYFSRDIDEFLLKWKSKKDHCALEVTGARQVGKTTSLEHFAQHNYENVIKIDLTSINKETYFKYLDIATSVKGFLINVAKLNNVQFTDDKNTLVLIDEIQESEQIYRLIRPINRELNCDLIVTGSYLGKTESYFQPAGDLEYYTLNTMSFLEFLECYNARAYYENNSISTLIEKKGSWFNEAYMIYRAIGGYPSVVSAYMQKESVKDALTRVLHTILIEVKGHMSDISDYSQVALLLPVILQTAINEKKGDTLLYEHLKKGIQKYNNFKLSKKEIYNIITWLMECNLIGYVDKFDIADDNVFTNARIYFKDLGILNYVAIESGIAIEYYEDYLSENFVYRCFLEPALDQHFRGTHPSFGVYKNYEYDFYMCDYHKGSAAFEIETSKGSSKSMEYLIQHDMADNYCFLTNENIFKKSDNVNTIPIWCFNKIEFRKRMGDIKYLKLFDN